jgi:hypothetical protein
MNLDRSGGGSALRRAALHLHAMQPADRDWLLRNLAPPRRELLEVLLRELVTLGIPRDLEPPQAKDAGATQAQAPGLATAADRLEQIPAEDVDWLAARLHEEPPEVAALLLSGRQWPWRKALVERLDAARRRCVEASANVAACAPAQVAVIEALAAMLPVSAPLDARARKVPRWWRRQ